MTRTQSSSTADDPVFRIQPVRPISELRRESLAADPPIESGSFRAADLVDLAKLDARLRFDIRYASTRNFMGAAFYREERAFLQRPAADALRQVADDLWQQGYGLIIYDAYRPWFVTNMFWEATPESLKRFVADPENGSRHNRGAAVDAGLYDAASGASLEMPSGYDEFTERAHVDYDGGNPAARRHRDLLRTAMERHGFTVYPYEWWHFDHDEWRDYPIMNMPFEDI